MWNLTFFYISLRTEEPGELTASHPGQFVDSLPSGQCQSLYGAVQNSLNVEKFLLCPSIQFPTTLINSPMLCITPTSAEDFNQVAYFRFTNEFLLPGDISVKPGSVLEFCGGYFSSSGEATVNLNQAQVVGAPYCIFRKNVTVEEFAQAEVLAEWFNDPGLKTNSQTGDEAFINKAIKCANGCPVVLESRQYNLKGSVKFTTGLIPQTLICPGILKIDSVVEDTSAILLEDVSYATLRINTIEGTTTQTAGGSQRYGGIGIGFQGKVHMADIEVSRMFYLKIGFDMSPQAKNGEAFIQDCKFKFQYIWATTCIRVDLFTKNNSTEYPGCWITSNQFYGGRLRGENGIMFGAPSSGFFKGAVSRPSAHAHSLVFENITVEHMTKTPVYLAYVSQSKIINAKIGEGLPGLGKVPGNVHSPWIALYNVSDIEISLKSYLYTSHLAIVDDSTVHTPSLPSPGHYFPNVINNVIVKGDVVDSDWYQNHFDTVLFRTSFTANGSPQPRMLVTSSIQPFNMAKVVSVGVEGNNVSLNNLVPVLEGYVHTSKSDSEQPQSYIDILPDTFFLHPNNGNTGDWIIHLDGISRFPKMIPSFYLALSPGTKAKFVKPAYKGMYLVKNFEETKASEIVFDEGAGLYRLQWGGPENSVNMGYPTLRIIRVAD